MTDMQIRQFMRNFFERYYQKLEQIGNGIAILRPLDESDRAMWCDDADSEQEWKAWKLIPTVVTDKDIEQLEKDIDTKLPQCLRYFLTVYHHYFDSPIGCNPISNPFEAILNAWNPILVKYGYLPFTWDREGYYIRCIDLKNMPDDEQSGIYLIDHEVLFSMDESNVQREDIDENMEYLSQNFFAYLENILNEGELI